MTNENMQMDGDEYLRATFFSTEEEVAALKQQDAAKREASLAKRRQTWKNHEEFRTAKAFIQALERLDHASRCAWVGYLADRWKV